jgi:hypothetical protein
MHRYLIGTATTLLALIGLAQTISARPVELWSEERLWKEADLVLIGTAKATADLAVDRGEGKKRDSRVEVETTFAIERVLQGKYGGKTVAVRHHRYFAKEAEIEVIDGPSFVEFNAKKQHRYLIFLKRTEGEKDVYQPLTGQYDPDQSFQQLVRYHVINER